MGIFFPFATKLKSFLIVSKKIELSFSRSISLQGVLFGVLIGMSAMTYLTINGVTIGNEFDINPTLSFGMQN